MKRPTVLWETDPLLLAIKLASDRAIDVYGHLDLRLVYHTYVSQIRSLPLCNQSVEYENYQNSLDMCRGFCILYR